MRDKIYTIDIESNNLLSEMVSYKELPYKLRDDASLWCVVIRDIETGEVKSAEKEQITKEWLKESLSDCKVLVAHNGVKFDFLALHLFGVMDYKIGYLGEPDLLFGEECRFIDTLILSRLGNPDRYGGHSLKAWGERLGEKKDDYRQQCIDAGYIEKTAPKGAEFRAWNPLMLPYCIQDNVVNAKVYIKLVEEFYGHNWGQSVKMEHKLADLGIRRELFGFDFDKEGAIKAVEELNQIMQDLADKVEPLLPPKPLNKTELSFWTPPATQLKKDGSISKHMERFVTRIGAKVRGEVFIFEGQEYEMPYNKPLKETVKAEMKDFDHIKMFLIDEFGWLPTEWSERDITKDSKKKPLTLEKQQQVLDRWWNETLEGKYRKGRIRELDVLESKCYDMLQEKLGGQWPARVPTSPKIRVGVEKELCPNLIKLGEDVQFAKDFADWLTYRHRRNSIAGGDLSDINLYEEEPSSGFLFQYREEDGRIPTPAIEIGAVTSRYVHIGVANIARPSSIYGKEMRSLFRAGKGGVFFGFDYSSLEARIMAHYVHKYPKGPELGVLFTGEKPNDWHSNQALAMGVSRGDAKSIDYGILYGAQKAKIKKMTGKTMKESEEIVTGFWDGSPALKDLRDAVIKFWESTGKKYVTGIDGRKINVRSKHALLNSLFQSAGVIFAKYVSVFIMEKYEKEGLCIDPFKGSPDVSSMIEYHDEEALFCKPYLFKFKTFETEEDANNFVKNWDGPQLSAVSEGNVWYVALPSIISTIIEETVQQVTEMLKINVEMGFEYMVGNNWFECH